MIQTYDLVIRFNGYDRKYYNISIVAVNRFVEWYRASSPDYKSAVYGAHKQLTSH